MNQIFEVLRKYLEVIKYTVKKTLLSKLVDISHQESHINDIIEVLENHQTAINSLSTAMSRVMGNDKRGSGFGDRNAYSVVCYDPINEKFYISISYGKWLDYISGYKQLRLNEKSSCGEDINEKDNITAQI